MFTASSNLFRAAEENYAIRNDQISTIRTKEPAGLAMLSYLALAGEASIEQNYSILLIPIGSML